MGEFSIWHWLIVLGVVLLLFGGNKMSSLMGDFAKGIKAFKKNMSDDSDHGAPASLEGPAAKTANIESAVSCESERVPG
jgi:sec-independent protein translocase protein TatA